VLGPGSVRHLLDALAVPGTGIVAPQVRAPDGTLHRSLRREPTLLRALGLTRLRAGLFSEYVGDPHDYLHPHTVDWALGAVLLVSAECHRALGGWDESFFLYSEETDFSLRARELGFATRYEPAARAQHLGQQSGYDGTIHSMQILNRVRLYRRRHGALASWLYYGLTVLSELSWVARGADVSRRSVSALLRPGRRPPELGCSTGRLPA
jgi:GT2 family glycosyltransferase